MHPFWRFVTDFGDTAVTVPLALLMTCFLLRAREPRLAFGWALAILGCAAAIGGLKILLGACGEPFAAERLSSPSGHTAMSTAVYGGFAAVLGSSLARPARDAVLASAAALLAGIALSRAILHYHSAAEIALGLAIGSAALAAILIAMRRHPPRRLPVPWLAAAAVVLALLLHGARWPAEQVVHRLAGLFDFVRPWCG